MVRTRIVLKGHSEVAHIWAQQSQEEGRAGNMFFEGTDIYSYGRHFMIATFVKPDVVLFTTRNYSNSTAKHKILVLRAISQYKVFTVPSFYDHKGNVQWMISMIETSFESASRSRKYTLHILGSIVESAKQVLDYANEFGVLLTDNQKEVIIKAQNALNEDALVEVKTKLAERTKKELENNKEKIADWIAGVGYSLPSSIKKVFLRTKPARKDVVETSLGADVLLSEARLLFKCIKNNEDVKGFSIGHYKVLSYKNGSLTVGCHKIDEDEINRFAATQGWN